MNKKNIAVAMGGYSSEFEISLGSGEVVCKSLDNSKYNIYPVHILKENWYYVNSDGDRFLVNKADFSFFTGSETIIPDAIFNTVHGTPGENGYLQAYWELLGIPQTSSGFYQAAVSFNKRDCIIILKRFGVKCADSYYLNIGDEINEEEILKKVGLPCFVKPNRAGSSFGISKVNTKKELRPAIKVAFKEDHEIMIEKALVGVEVSVGVYSNNDEVIALPVTEIVSENEFFDYDAKYLGKSEEITPARISAKETITVQEEAKRIHSILNMKGVTRSDFIIQNGEPYFIEINTTPGISKESIIPKQVRQTGMSLKTFFGILVENALNKK
jgi:D-alanine-D-alanine ligase